MSVVLALTIISVVVVLCMFTLIINTEYNSGMYWSIVLLTLMASQTVTQCEVSMCTHPDVLIMH